MLLDRGATRLIQLPSTYRQNFGPAKLFDRNPSEIREEGDR